MKMLKKFNQTVSIRSQPVNLSEEDAHLFTHEFTKIIPSSSLKKYKNIYLSNSQLKKYKYFRFQIKHQRMNPIDFKVKLRYFFGDLYHFLFLRKKNTPIIIDKATWAIDSRSSQYFHWLTDAMQRISIAEDYYDQYPILLTEDFKNTSFVKESLKNLKINSLQVKKDTDYLIKELVLSERVSPAGNYRDEVIKDVSKKLLESVNTSEKKFSYEKIWISRQNADKRKTENFKDLSIILSKHGFHIVELEKYTFTEQIKIISRCKVLAGVHGAGLVNMLFMKAGSKIIEVRGRNDSKNNCYFSLASNLEMDYFYFLSDTPNDDYYSGNPSIDIKSFDTFLNKFKS